MSLVTVVAIFRFFGDPRQAAPRRRLFARTPSSPHMLLVELPASTPILITLVDPAAGGQTLEALPGGLAPRPRVRLPPRGTGPRNVEQHPVTGVPHRQHWAPGSAFRAQPLYSAVLLYPMIGVSAECSCHCSTGSRRRCLVSIARGAAAHLCGVTPPGNLDWRRVVDARGRCGGARHRVHRVHGALRKSVSVGVVRYSDC